MFSALSSIFRPFSQRRYAMSLYRGVVAASREPVFYTALGVSDDLEGRFDMILLHMFLVTEVIEASQGKKAEPMIRTLQEIMVQDMDRSLREMGVGDMSIGKKVQAMGEAWFGRRAAYKECLHSADPAEELGAALDRNLYGGSGEGTSISAVVQYMMAAWADFEQRLKGGTAKLDEDAVKSVFEKARDIAVAVEEKIS